MAGKNSGNGNGQEEIMYDFKAEKAVLGAILVDAKIIDKVIKIIGVNPDVFFDQRNKEVYITMLELLKHSTPIDLLPLIHALDQKGELENFSNGVYLLSLVEEMDADVNPEKYAQIVKEKYLLRCRIKGWTHG